MSVAMVAIAAADTLRYLAAIESRLCRLPPGKRCVVRFYTATPLRRAGSQHGGPVRDLKAVCVCVCM